MNKDDTTEYVTIPKREYESLLDDAKWRECLEGGGVDNWSYYSDSLREVGYFDEEDDE
ncbi:hypothetical protein [Sinorhizobium medicae]|uniref:hypothetical protein n=1 Tax=Sinorhizobium medicae TaxID=110321 RepID=UPI0013E33BCB|nr:hypothetical protein [Sinorhizobium medicae]UWU09416.1 hypothetical protein N2598_06655 [Sinorhizobium medicae]